MLLSVRISCDRFPAHPDGYPNHGNNAIELASALRRLAAAVDRAADYMAEGQEFTILDDDGRVIGRAAYRMVEPV